jgi:CheY-like chemotaxis protein
MKGVSEISPNTDQYLADRINALFGTARLIVSGVFGQKRKKLVMVVEREQGTLTLINKLLRRMAKHCEVVRSKDGAEAFATVCSRPPDLIIANPELYGINGFRFVDNLKMDHFAKKIPLVMTTGLTQASLLTNLLVNLRGGGFTQSALG